jgi:CelD/BcsL family acetyltransferase involved in cellulose biosynthesis
VTVDFDLGKKTKKHKIRRYLGRLADQHGEVAFVRHTGATLDEGLDRLVMLHDKRWAALDEPMQGLMAAPDTQAFLLDAVRALDQVGALRLLTLEAGGTPIGVELDFRFRDHVFLFKGAFDPDYAAFSPGQLLNHQVFVQGLDEGVEMYDWCRGDAGYKRRWTNGERHLSTVTLTRPGVAGHVARQRERAARAVARVIDIRREPSRPR